MAVGLLMGLPVAWAPAAAAPSALAQATAVPAPAPAPDPVARASALAIGGDTAAALAVLDSAVRAGPRNGPA